MKKSIYDRVKNRILELGLMEEKDQVTFRLVVLAILDTDKSEDFVSAREKYKFEGDFISQSNTFGIMVLNKLS